MASKSNFVEDELIRLKRRLERERSARLEAEAIAEKSTRELYEKQKELLLLQKITVASNEASTVEGAMQVALDEVCTYTRWPVGHVYMIAEDSTGELVPTTVWHLDDPGRFETFRKVTEITRLVSGSGLPGRVLESRKSAWIIDVTKDTNFPRVKQAQDIGVRAGFGFPVLVGKEVVAVLEFFTDEAIEPDERLLEVMAHVGTQLGRVVERRRAEETLHRAYEESYRNLFENILTGIYRTTPDGRIIMANPVLIKMLGYSSFDELASRDLEKEGFDVDYPRSQFKELIEQKGEISGLESAWVRRDGSVVFVLESTRAVRREGGTVLYYEGTVEDITERKRAEEALKQSEEQFRVIFQESLDVVMIVEGGSGQILKANEAARRILGYESTALIGRHFSVLFPPETKLSVEDLLEKLRVRESVFESQDFLRADGSVCPMDLTVTLIPWGKDEAIVATLRDITERKQMEESLKENLNHLDKKNCYENIIGTVTRSVHQSIDLQEVLENAVDAMSKNIDGVDNIFISIVEGKEAVLKAYRGYPDWFIQRVGRIPYPKGATWKAIIEGKPIYCADAEKDTALGPAGREVGTKSYLSMPIRFGERTVGVININSLKKNAFNEEELKLLENVAEQIEAAINNARITEALRRSEGKFRSLVEHINEWIWEIDKDGLFVYVSPQAYEIVGYEPGEIIGKTTFDFMSPDEAQRFAKVIGQFIAVQKPFVNLEKTLIHKDGHQVIVETSGSPVFDSQGVLQGYRGIARNITERKKIEEEILKAQKLESLGVLAGGIAHDFNNLLTAILGNISLTRMYVSSEDKIYKRLTEAEKACLRASNLTQRLITFSKGGAPIKKVVPSLGGLIKDTASFAVSGSNVRCEFIIDDGLWPVKADEGQISQVINNLVINADQAMPKGGVIKVRVGNVNLKAENVGAGFKPAPTKEGRYVRITVEDEGAGIAEEHLSKIFDPYFTTKEKSNGLGLATAHSVIKNHDGHIGVESEMGIGTKFYVYLPATGGEEAREEGEREAPKESVGRVLVMDDEEVVRGVAGEILNHLKFEVEFATDGGEAVEIYKRASEEGNPFDVVIMDLTIPGGMGGRETIKKILDVDPGVKAILSSGYSNDPVISEYRKYGFRGAVTKPYKIEEFSETLRRVINENV